MNFRIPLLQGCPNLERSAAEQLAFARPLLEISEVYAVLFVLYISLMVRRHGSGVYILYRA